MKTLLQSLNESIDVKKLNREFDKLNKEYIALDKANDKETNENTLRSNYDKMDAIQARMAVISGQLENL